MLYKPDTTSTTLVTEGKSAIRKVNPIPCRKIVDYFEYEKSIQINTSIL